MRGNNDNDDNEKCQVPPAAWACSTSWLPDGRSRLARRSGRPGARRTGRSRGSSPAQSFAPKPHFRSCSEPVACDPQRQATQRRTRNTPLSWCSHRCDKSKLCRLAPPFRDPFGGMAQLSHERRRRTLAPGGGPRVRKRRCVTNQVGHFGHDV